VDTVSVIDLEVSPPRVIDKIVVGDAPEGFASARRAGSRWRTAERNQRLEERFLLQPQRPGRGG